jgi:alkylated DNA nucleotide flippase Atl1
MELDELSSRVLDLVDRVPVGRVVTYGDVAARAGTGPRQVGRIMARVGHLTCWWRVVRADGTSAVAGQASQFWEAEGIPHRDGRVVLGDCRWEFP